MSISPGEQPLSPLPIASPVTGALHTEFRDIKSRLLAASRNELDPPLNRETLRKLTHRMGEIIHALQETSATGPKRVAKQKKEKADPTTPIDDGLDI